MSGSTFVYVTYIRTTPEKLWAALTTPDFQRSYWAGNWQDTTWQPGTAWQLKFADGRVADAGEVLEAEKPKRIVITWRNEFRPELKAEGFSRCTFEIEPEANACKLTVVHEIDKDNSQLITAVSGGWPKILSSLKTLLETGTAIPVAGGKAAS
jgi:uncharacterized protein YndB with AHSA1/START domain